MDSYESNDEDSNNLDSKMSLFWLDWYALITLITINEQFEMMKKVAT